MLEDRSRECSLCCRASLAVRDVCIPGSGVVAAVSAAIRVDGNDLPRQDRSPGRLANVVATGSAQDEALRRGELWPVQVAANFTSMRTTRGTVAKAATVLLKSRYLVTNGGGAIRSTQLTSRFFASFRNSIAIRSIQPGSVRPSTPWPASAIMTCLLFGKWLAA